jgi:DNA (cytosine-5)-methyltransferase 1
MMSEIEQEQKEQKEQKGQLRVLDLFCGCGGMSLGLEWAGLHVLAGVDIWPCAIQSYQHNHPDHLGLCEDLRMFSPQELEEKHGIRRGQVDVIVGGPPCQSFSMAGRRDKSDPRNTLFMEYVKFLDYYQPRAFLMENVMGILSKKTEAGEKVIDLILGELGRGYHCMVNKLMASDFEVPQNRRRVIITGIRKDLCLFPPIIQPFFQTVDQRIPVGRVLLFREAVGAEYYLSARALEGIRKKKEKSREMGRGFGAQMLDLDRPSYTIPARYWKDGADALVRYSDTDVRRLTILELKRIQTFPDDYSLAGSKKDQIIQLGNAVPCRFAYHLGVWLQRLLS